MTRNKGTRKYFGHLKVTGFEDLKIYDNIHHLKNRGCSIYSPTQPTFPRRVLENDTPPWGLEEDRCTENDQQADIASRDQ